MSSNGKKVLVVDDEADILELLKYNLKKEGYQVKAVNNGADAVGDRKNIPAGSGAA
jgi:two-component system alkaline phosphatase synthesis response regulator PhoP